MVQYGSRWCNVVHFGSELCIMVQYGFDWFRMTQYVSDDDEWLRVVVNGLVQLRNLGVVRYSSKCFRKMLEG